MFTQSVLSAVVAQFRDSGWPQDELIGFGVDPDGEVRGHTDIYNDFYPKIEISKEFIDEGVYIGDEDSKVLVTKEMFEEAIKNA